MIIRRFRRPVVWVAGLVLTAGMVFGLYWFQPWTLFLNERVDEALSDPVALPPADASATPPESAAGPVLVTEGEFITHEYRTAGTARIIRNPDGSHQLELVELDTSNGPDLRVWLTDQPVIEGRDGWHVFDDGRWLDLGELKGNQGNQVYELPADADPSDYTSVSIWCERFSVSFGAASL